MPVFHPADTFVKHRKVMKTCYADVWSEMRQKVLALTPKSNSFGVEWQSPTDANIGARCLVTGEPFHDLISLRRAVSTSAPDCQDLILDHMDMMSRLSSPLLPGTSVQGSVIAAGEDGFADSTTAAERLLKIAVERLAYNFERC